MVQAPGLEPGRLAAADFKSAAYTYSATLACWGRSQGSNLLPMVYKAIALPNELDRHYWQTVWVTIPSTKVESLVTSPEVERFILVRPTGFEPVIVGFR